MKKVKTSLLFDEFEIIDFFGVAEVFSHSKYLLLYCQLFSLKRLEKYHN